MILKLNCPNKCCQNKPKINVKFSKEEMQRCLNLVEDEEFPHMPLEMHGKGVSER